MDHDYTKWDDYTIGSISWINSRKNHIAKATYVDYIINSDIKSVLEIGAGEVTEGQHIVAKCDVNYTVLDVSDTFLDNARKLGFRCIKAEMHNTGCKNKEFDIVHLSAVLEHTPDVFATVKELRRISNQFYITLFKWRFLNGGLKSQKVKKGEKFFFSTEFNVSNLISLLKANGDIKDMTVYTLNNEIIPWIDYKNKYKDTDRHRNGNYLSIVGEWK